MLGSAVATMVASMADSIMPTQRPTKTTYTCRGVRAGRGAERRGTVTATGSSLAASCVPEKTPPGEKLRNGRSSLLGYRMVEIGEGRSLVSWTPGDNVGNPMGFVHGGFVGVMVDGVAGLRVPSLLPG